MKINLQKIVLQIRVTKHPIKHYTKDILYRFLFKCFIYLFIYFNGELLWYHEYLDFFPLLIKTFITKLKFGVYCVIFNI